MELSVGMLALTLIVSALCLFAVYIAKSLRAQNELRSGNGGIGSRSDSVEVDGFAQEWFVGVSSLRINEKAVLPERTILR